MKASLILMIILGCASASAETLQPIITATGTIYFEFDMASEARADGVNFAKFIPDAESRSVFDAVADAYATPFRYVSFEPADRVLEKTLGKSEAEHISHGSQNRIAIRVRVQLKNLRPEIECDSRVDYADLVSVNSLEHFQIATNGSVPDGC